MHHGARNCKITDKTLLDNMVSEGLALHYEYIISGRYAFEDFEVDPTIVEKMRKRILPELDRRSPIKVHYDTWFRDRPKGEIIPQIGYELSYNMVSRYLQEHPHENAATLVHAPSEIFRPYV